MSHIVTAGPLALDMRTRALSDAGSTICILPGVRARILEHLMRNPHRAFSASDLADALWGVGNGRPDNVRVHIHSLRADLGEQYRHCIPLGWGGHYRFIPPVSDITVRALTAEEWAICDEALAAHRRRRAA